MHPVDLLEVWQRQRTHNHISQLWPLSLLENPLITVLFVHQVPVLALSENILLCGRCLLVRNCIAQVVEARNGQLDLFILAVGFLFELFRRRLGGLTLRLRRDAVVQTESPPILDDQGVDNCTLQRADRCSDISLAPAQLPLLCRATSNDRLILDRRHDRTDVNRETKLLIH